MLPGSSLWNDSAPPLFHLREVAAVGGCTAVQNEVCHTIAICAPAVPAPTLTYCRCRSQGLQALARRAPIFFFQIREEPRKSLEPSPLAP